MVQRNTLTRAGGKHYGYDHGALKLFASFNAITSGVVVKDILIQDPVLNGIQFEGTQAIQNVSFDGVQINNYGTMGLWVTSGLNGSIQASNVVVVAGAINKGMQNDSPNTFTIQRGTGDNGW
jgi:hypothetical protein